MRTHYHGKIHRCKWLTDGQRLTPGPDGIERPVRCSRDPTPPPGVLDSLDRAIPDEVPEMRRAETKKIRDLPPASIAFGVHGRFVVHAPVVSLAGRSVELVLPASLAGAVANGHRPLSTIGTETAEYSEGTCLGVTGPF